MENNSQSSTGGKRLSKAPSAAPTPAKVEKKEKATPVEKKSKISLSGAAALARATGTTSSQSSQSSVKSTASKSAGKTKKTEVDRLGTKAKDQIQTRVENKDDKRKSARIAAVEAKKPAPAVKPKVKVIKNKPNPKVMRAVAAGGPSK